VVCGLHLRRRERVQEHARSRAPWPATCSAWPWSSPTARPCGNCPRPSRPRPRTWCFCSSRPGRGDVPPGRFLPAHGEETDQGRDRLLQPMTSILLSLARGLRERSQADGYRRSLEILAEIEGELTACEDPARALRILARGGRELLDCDRAAIVVVDERAGTFEGAVETAEGSEACGLNLLTSGEIAAVLEKGHALYSPYSGEAGMEQGSVERPSKSLSPCPLPGGGDGSGRSPSRRWAGRTSSESSTAASPISLPGRRSPCSNPTRRATDWRASRTRTGSCCVYRAASPRP